MSSDTFATVMLGATRSSAAPLIGELLRRTGRSKIVDHGDHAWLAAEFAPVTHHVAILREILQLGHNLRTMIVSVRGRTYPVGGRVHLHRWITCLAEMLETGAPASACEYHPRQVYRLEYGERLGDLPLVATLDVLTGETTVEGSGPPGDPRLHERYTLPCRALGWAAEQAIDRHAPGDTPSKLQALAHRVGCDGCPRFGDGTFRQAVAA